MPLSSSQDIPLDELLSVATAAARQAGAVLTECTRTGFRIEHKQLINLVTDADHQAEQCIIDVIHKAFPTHPVLAEERGLTEQPPSRYKWVIDPLDGTTNFAHGFPAYCVSIGVECDGQGIIGVVYDPTRNELFTAQIGQGARLNGMPITVSSADHLDRALLVTGFGYDIRENPNNNLNHFARFALKVQGLRRTGTAALDLCYVAAGRFDGFWEVKLNPWDMAAGVVILLEAGGKVSDFTGRSHSIYGQELVASNGILHQSMLDVLREEATPGNV
ncbi:MAG: inositol monophosphatase family protein [Nitrospirae bacterium]|nr:inositol monophosphatase family protein [Nitrospirota bacterium]